MTTRITVSEEETIEVGREVGRRLGPGSFVLIEGPLGAGKTAFVRGLAGGLGCNEAEVSSPTFTLVQEYRGRFRLQHVDLYRLASKEVDDLALDELGEGAVVAVEWAERWPDRPGDAIEVRIEPLDGSRRRISITSLEARG